MPKPNLHRRRKTDRQTAPDRVAVQGAITIDHIVGAYARRKAAADQKWGQGRLPEIVGTELTVKYGKAVETFERAMMKDPPDPVEVKSRVDNLIKGINRLDEEAERIGAERAPDGCIAMQVGERRAVLVWDPAAVTEVKRQQPDVAIYRIEEIERILEADAMKLVSAAKEHFQGAEIVELRRPRTKIEEELEDEIPF